METKEYIKQLILLLFLIMGAQSALADLETGWVAPIHRTMGNLSFDLYKFKTNTYINGDNVAVLTGISGTDENVVVPETVEDGGYTYSVGYIDGNIANDYVKTLTFKCYNGPSFNNALMKWGERDGIFPLSGTISCPNLKTLVVGRISDNPDGVTRLLCPQLTDIVFTSENAPVLEGSWSDYCSAPGDRVTAHVAAWTQAECNQKHQTATVWSDLRAVLHYDPEVGIGPQTVNLKITVQCTNYPPGAPVDPNNIYVNYNGEKVYGGQTQTFVVEKGSAVDIIVTSAHPTPYSVYWSGKTYVDGVLRQHNGPFRLTDSMQEDIELLEVCEPDCYFVPVANLSAEGTHSLFWKDVNNQEYEIAPQSTFLVPVKKSSTTGTNVYAMAGQPDGYTLLGYWYKGQSYMNNADISAGGVSFKNELASGETHRLNFTLQPTSEQQARQVLIGTAESTQSKVHVKVIGEPAGLEKMVFEGSSPSDVIELADLASFDHTYLLDEGTQYRFSFLGAKNMNLKRLTINGEEVEVTGNVIKITGYQLLGSFDDDVVIEFPKGTYVNAYANNNAVVSIAKVVDGEEPHFVARDNSMHQWVNDGETYIIKFIPMNGEELIRFDIGMNSVDIQQESRLVKNDDGSYSFTLTYNDIPSPQDNFDMLAVFESSQAGTSYDLNHDGQVNITDVIILVNRILGNN